MDNYTYEIVCQCQGVYNYNILKNSAAITGTLQGTKDKEETIKLIEEQIKKLKQEDTNNKNNE